MTPSVGEEADRELTDAAVYYAREASPALALAFVAESAQANLLGSPEVSKNATQIATHRPRLLWRWKSSTHPARAFGGMSDTFKRTRTNLGTRFRL